MTRLRMLAAAVLLVAVPAAAPAAGARRLVMIKADGLAFDLLDRAVRERNPRTGKSSLPWIEHVFYEGGTRISNFYVRGMSLSGPSWSMLDTGQHLQIKGNVEFDRYTHHAYDYLNFIPFWIGNAAGRRGDMWGTSVLDDLGVPLLLDAFPFDDRYQSFQLYQRGTRWVTLRQGLQKRVTSRTVRDLVDEWLIGIDTRGILSEQLERELIEKLGDPRVRYLDYYTTDFDHATHHNRDFATQLTSLQQLDAVVGRIWTAIERTPEARDTVMVLVSDHGVNTDEGVYSQGFNLVNLLTAASGGGHHVITKRRLMKDYSIKGIYPLVPLITTTSSDSKYLQGLSDTYPTALVDFDGNERASIHLRDSSLNMLQILFGEMRRADLPAPVRRAATNAFLDVVASRRPAWEAVSTGLREELSALGRELEVLRAAAPPPRPERRRGKPAPVESVELQQARIRAAGRIEDWTRDLDEYAAYADTVDRLLGATADSLAAPGARIENLVAPHAMGERNSLFDLQHYVVGPARGGLVLDAAGRLDLDKSFERVDYFQLLEDARVQNNVQRGVSSHPVDFTAARLECDLFDTPDPAIAAAETCIWLDGGRDAQALVIGRHDEGGTLRLRYLPIARLSQDSGGRISFSPSAWAGGFPLKLWEDPQLQTGQQSRREWLDAWHTDAEWLRASHRTHYSNAVVGLHEQFAVQPAPSLDLLEPGLTEDARLMRRFRLRQRAVVEPDILIVASDHWNFDVRGFNPGGNHGSFLRPSTHATLMFAGGEGTGIPRGLAVAEPYDSLSVMPTMLRLIGKIDPEGRPAEDLREKGFRALPGRPIRELFEPGYFRTTEISPEKVVSESTAPLSSP